MPTGGRREGFPMLILCQAVKSDKTKILFAVRLSGALAVCDPFSRAHNAETWFPTCIKNCMDLGFRVVRVRHDGRWARGTSQVLVATLHAFFRLQLQAPFFASLLPRRQARGSRPFDLVFNFCSRNFRVGTLG